MSQRYQNAAAFRQGLEARLRAETLKRAVPLESLRLKLAIERFLARIFEDPGPGWLLKGGYSMELRFRPRARTTRDVDLSSPAPSDGRSLRRETHDRLQVAARSELSDWFEFVVEPARDEIDAAPGAFPSFACWTAECLRDSMLMWVLVMWLLAQPRNCTGTTSSTSRVSSVPVRSRSLANSSSRRRSTPTAFHGPTGSTRDPGTSSILCS